VSGIPLKVHWTFWVMLAGLFAYYLYQGASVTAAGMGVALVVAVFGCVVLHELGHAMAARRYGIPTLDITLFPIGGVARLQRIPKKPIEELVIALAGPAVNLVIAIILFRVGGVSFTAESLAATLGGSVGILAILAWINIGLMVFNLIPAFPMDGGRVLRAGLATQVDYRTATSVAALAAHGIALLMFVYGIVSMNVGLPFVAIFIVLAARQEVAHVMERG
jgi:Zn-dependent protease